MTTYHDNQRIDFAGRRPRIICADNRPGMRTAVVRAFGADAASAPQPTWPVTDGTDSHGAFLRFATQTGDQSANDRKGKLAKDVPMRAFLAFDGGEEATPSAGRRDAMLVQRFGLVIEPGAPVRPNLHTTLCQYNVSPGKGLAYRPPAMEFGLVSQGRTTKRKDGKVVGVIDPKTKRPFLDEYLQLIGHVWNDAAGKVESVGLIRTFKPIKRDKLYTVELRFRDGQGGDGSLELVINGVSKGVYTGPVGYAGYGVPYPSLGVYQHVEQVPVAARFYGWSEEARVAA